MTQPRNPPVVGPTLASPPMLISEFQASIVDFYCQNPDSLTYSMLGLAGETGEVIEKYKKALRIHQPEDLRNTDIAMDIADELGDVLWYMARICQEIGVSLNDVAQMNITKLAARRAEAV